jgi:hypothetical protein
MLQPPHHASLMPAGELSSFRHLLPHPQESTALPISESRLGSLFLVASWQPRWGVAPYVRTSSIHHLIPGQDLRRSHASSQTTAIWVFHDLVQTMEHIPRDILHGFRTRHCFWPQFQGYWTEEGPSGLSDIDSWNALSQFPQSGSLVECQIESAQTLMSSKKGVLSAKSDFSHHA